MDKYNYISNLEIIAAINNSIDHHRRMRDAALFKFFPFAKLNYSIFYNSSGRSRMLDKIGENWKANYCALCNLFECESTNCYELCPLSRIGQNCTYNNSVWKKLNQSKIWIQFVFNENRMIKALKSTLNIYKDRK